MNYREYKRTGRVLEGEEDKDKWCLKVDQREESESGKRKTTHEKKEKQKQILNLRGGQSVAPSSGVFAGAGPERGLFWFCS